MFGPSLRLATISSKELDKIAAAFDMERSLVRRSSRRLDPLPARVALAPPRFSRTGTRALLELSSS